MSQKAKMCKSPKSIVYSQSQQPQHLQHHQLLHPQLPMGDKIEYENLSTNCTIVGSNNLHLVKKPQIVATGMSPAYSNPSPGYPQSPYSSPASLKSPSPQGMKPPTPQPNTIPVMQIIHNSHPVMARQVHSAQQQNVIKLKPPLNILPKPSASPQQSPKPSVSPQIVLPASQQATIVPAPQPLVLNQVPMLTTSGVQFILRPQATKLPTAQTVQTPQGLILQQSGQQLLQLQPPRSQPMVRVLTNGVGMPTTTYVTQLAPQSNMQPQQQQQTQHQQQHQPQTVVVQSQSPTKKKPHKKKKQKLDLANIMKLSGIGDDDDVQFESDTSLSESEPNAHSQPATPQPAPVTPTMVQPQQGIMHQPDGKGGHKMGNIQISAVPQAISAAGTPLVQVLNQTFQQGGQAQAAQPTSIPFSPFITPNFTINNGLMVQRSGGFKLALGEDGRLVLQHDPTLNQDIQSQLLLQSIFGLNGGLVLQPSIDQQIHSQTVQTIQQQSVQTIQQQTVQSQTIQTVQHQIVQPQTLQSIQSQLQGQIQSLLQQQNMGSQSIAIQPQNITIQPQGLQGLQVSQPISIHSQPITLQSQSQPITIQAQNQPITIQSQAHNNLMSQPQQVISLGQGGQTYSTGGNLQIQPQPPPPPSPQAQPQQSPHQHSFTQTMTTNAPTTTQPVLKVQPFQKTQPPVQTVHPIHHHHSAPTQQPHGQPNQPTSYVVNLTPEQLEQLKRNGQLTVNGQTIFMQRQSKNDDNKKTSPKIKPMKKVSKLPAVVKDSKAVNNLDKTINHVVKEAAKTNMHHTPVKNLIPPVKTQPSAIIQPSVQPQSIQPKQVIPQPKLHVIPNIQPPPTTQPVEPPPVTTAGTATNTQEVERLLGQLIEETQPQQPPTPTPSSNAPIVITSPTPLPAAAQGQRVHTIQLTPQKQQHLKSIQLQIQTLSARLTPGNVDMQNALKLLFQEQQKILATGKLLPPEKVFYHNNQLIVNNSSVGMVKNDVAPSQPSSRVAPVTTSTPVVTVPSSQQQQQPPQANPPQQQQQHQIQPKAPTPVVTTAEPCAPATTTPPVTTTVSVPKVVISAPISVATTTLATTPTTRSLPLYTRAQLIEQQLNTDQNGAVKPDIHTEFKDKGDACKRLIRYHCFDQPVLSQKDLDKADEIFELTARHFIDKFGRMVDKYRFLLQKESQRHVQTSELMMLDRMFLAEEQQSLIKLRQEIDECNLEMQQAAMQQQMHQQQQQSQPNQPQQVQPSPVTDQNSGEEYDEWACIQRELGCLPPTEEPKKSVGEAGASGTATTTSLAALTTGTAVVNATPSVTTVQAVKRSSSSDSRLESLKKFRVEKHVKKSDDGSSTTSSQFVQAAYQSSQQSIHNNVHCSTVLSSSSIVHGTTTNSYDSGGNVMQRAILQGHMMRPNPSCAVASRTGGAAGMLQHSSYNSTMHIHTPGIQRVQSSVSASSVQSVQPSGLHHQSSMHHQSSFRHHQYSSAGTQHIVQHITHTVHHTSQQMPPTSSSSNSVHSAANSYSSSNEELDNNDSIDEQVQSAIDSILNLQQNTSLELDETMQNMLS